MLQQVAERLGLVVCLLLFFSYGDAGIFLEMLRRDGIHIPDDGIRIPEVFEYLVPVPEKRVQRPVAADYHIRPAEKLAGIFLFRKVAAFEDDRFHYAFVLAISALEVPAVVV